MAKQGSAAAAKPNLFDKAKTFMNEVWTEMNKVTWPSPEEVKASTKIVLMILVILAVIIGVYDKVFEVIVVKLLQLGG